MKSKIKLKRRNDKILKEIKIINLIIKFLVPIFKYNIQNLKYIKINFSI